MFTGCVPPVVLTKEELVPVFRALDGEHRLFAQLLYGTGMRILEGGAVRSLLDAMAG